jgi:hypothetical protein
MFNNIPFDTAPTETDIGMAVGPEITSIDIPPGAEVSPGLSMPEPVTAKENVYVYVKEITPTGPFDANCDEAFFDVILSVTSDKKKEEEE